jgi:hypothetical protein
MSSLAAFLALTLLTFTQSAIAQVPSVFVNGLSCVGGRYGMSMPRDIRVLTKSAKMIGEEVSEVERWNGYEATRKSLRFDGLELGVVVFSNDPARYLVTYAVIESPSWNRLTPFKIGLPVAQAATRFGAVAKSDPALARTYAGESESVKIHSSEGIVTRVEYECYSG